VHSDANTLAVGKAQLFQDRLGVLQVFPVGDELSGVVNLANSTVLLVLADQAANNLFPCDPARCGSMGCSAYVSGSSSRPGFVARECSSAELGVGSGRVEVSRF